MSGKGYSPTHRLGSRSNPWRRLTVLLVLLLLVGACGGDDSADEAAAAAKAEAATTADEAPAAAEAEAATAAAAAGVMVEEEEMVEEEAMVALDEAQMALAESVDAATEAAEAASMAAEAASEAELDSGEAMEEEAPDEEAAEGDVSPVSDTSSGGTVVELSTANSPAAFGRDVIYRAWVSVEAPDVCGSHQPGHIHRSRSGGVRVRATDARQAVALLGNRLQGAAGGLLRGAVKALPGGRTG